MRSKDEQQQEEKQIRNLQKHEQFDLHLRYYRNHQICREKSREISWDFMEMKLQIGEKREIRERKMGIWENLHRNLKWKEKEISRDFKSEYWKREVRNAWRWKGPFIPETGLGKRKMGAVTASPPYAAAFMNFEKAIGWDSRMEILWWDPPRIGNSTVGKLKLGSQD